MKAIVCSLAMVAAVLVPCQFSRGQTPEPSHDGRALREWIERTKARNDAVREDAAIAIGKLGPEAKAAVPTLSKLLDDKSWYVREAAAQALERIAPHSEYVPSEHRPSHAAAQALEQIAPDVKSTEPLLVITLGRKEVTNRFAAAIALGKICPGSKAAALALAEAAIDEDGDVRDAAIEALIELRAEAKVAVPVLAKHVNSKESDDVRTYALIALGKIAPVANDAVPEMAKALKDDSLKTDAFAVLTDLGPAASPVLPQLVAMVREYSSGEKAEDHLPSRLECAKLICKWMHNQLALGTVTAARLWNILGAEDLPSVAPLLTSESTSDRALAIDKFYDLGQAAVPTLVDLVKGSEPETRRTAIRILEHIGPAAKAAVPALAATLKDKNSQDRYAAAIALGEIGADAMPALTEALAETDGSIRVCAIEALGRIGPTAAPAIAGLIGRLHDTSPTVRSAAARALGQIGPAAKAALPELEKLSRDREDYVRQAAGEAVKTISTAKPTR